MSKHVGKEFISEKKHPFEEVSIVIGRAVNGVTLNGLEYLLDERGIIAKFSTEEEAKSFLISKGYSEDALDGFVFEPLEEVSSDINPGEKARVESFDEEQQLYKVINLSIAPHWFMVSEQKLESLMTNEL